MLQNSLMLKRPAVPSWSMHIFDILTRELCTSESPVLLVQHSPMCNCDSLAAPAANEIQETNAEMLSLSRYSHVQPIENEVVIFLFGNLKVSICSMISNSKSLPQFWLGEASDSFSNIARDGGATLVSRCCLIFCWKVAWNYRFQWKKKRGLLRTGARCPARANNK